MAFFIKPASAKVQATQSSTSSAPNAAHKSNGQRAAVTNWATTVVIAVTNTPQPVPAAHVPAGCAVRVRANNGQFAGNAAIVFVADYPAKFAQGGATPLAPLDDILWPVSNTGRIWVYGKAGDGVVVSIVTPQ